MFEVIVAVLFIWLLIKAFVLAVKMTWCVTKVIAVFLFVIALPAMVICFLLASGVILLLPLLMVAGAVGLLVSHG